MASAGHGATVLVFTDGLSLVREAAGSGPRDLDGLCDHMIASCVAPDGVAREDDASLIAIRLGD